MEASPSAGFLFLRLQCRDVSLLDRTSEKGLTARFSAKFRFALISFWLVRNLAFGGRNQREIEVDLSVLGIMPKKINDGIKTLK